MQKEKQNQRLMDAFKAYQTAFKIEKDTTKDTIKRRFREWREALLIDKDIEKINKYCIRRLILGLLQRNLKEKKKS